MGAAHRRDGRAAGVAVNQVLTGGTSAPRWAVAAFVLCLVSEGLNQWLARRNARRPSAGEGGPGQRAVYLRQLRSHVQRLETIGITTRGVYVPELRRVYVDVSAAGGAGRGDGCPCCCICATTRPCRSSNPDRPRASTLATDHRSCHPAQRPAPREHSDRATVRDQDPRHSRILDSATVDGGVLCRGRPAEANSRVDEPDEVLILVRA
ncbi:hypothetical protein ACTIVE_0405 [Actinomadura verrucosospora]|uniref:Uncharacterized protein n=1 Tax=Actinomadura verrucosospora TaxID=46165 RepID=A0A7D4AKE6_ACTVE|nr:hypothetical protein ACTIVE_0405 [Actinomadura verrucosospora]